MTLNVRNEKCKLFLENPRWQIFFGRVFITVSLALSYIDFSRANTNLQKYSTRVSQVVSRSSERSQR